MRSLLLLITITLFQGYSYGYSYIPRHGDINFRQYIIMVYTTVSAVDSCNQPGTLRLDNQGTMNTRSGRSSTSLYSMHGKAEGNSGDISVRITGQTQQPKKHASNWVWDTQVRSKHSYYIDTEWLWKPRIYRCNSTNSTFEKHYI